LSERRNRKKRGVGFSEKEREKRRGKKIHVVSSKLPIFHSYIIIQAKCLYGEEDKVKKREGKEGIERPIPN